MAQHCALSPLKQIIQKKSTMQNAKCKIKQMQFQTKLQTSHHNLNEQRDSKEKKKKSIFAFITR